MSSDNPQGLNKAVAEAKGWYIYHYDKGPSEYYMLMDNEGNPVNYRYHENERKSEAEAWEKDCPNWAGDTSAALELADEAPRYEVTKMLSGRYESVLRGKELHEGTYMSTADTLPVSVCRAWLTWKGAKAHER